MKGVSRASGLGKHDGCDTECVVSKCRFQRPPGQNTITVMSVHIDNLCASKRSICVNWLLAMRSIIPIEGVLLVCLGMVFGDFNGAVPLREAESSLLELAFQHSEIPWPPGPSLLWGPRDKTDNWSLDGRCGIPQDPLGPALADPTSRFLGSRSCSTGAWQTRPSVTLRAVDPGAVRLCAVSPTQKGAKTVARQSAARGVLGPVGQGEVRQSSLLLCMRWDPSPIAGVSWQRQSPPRRWGPSPIAEALVSRVHLRHLCIHVPELSPFVKCMPTVVARVYPRPTSSDTS